MAALAEGGSSKETVASPFSFPVSLSVYRLIMGRPVFLLTYEDGQTDQKRDNLETKVSDPVAKSFKYLG